MLCTVCALKHGQSFKITTKRIQLMDKLLIDSFLASLAAPCSWERFASLQQHTVPQLVSPCYQSVYRLLCAVCLPAAQQLELQLSGESSARSGVHIALLHLPKGLPSRHYFPRVSLLVWCRAAWQMPRSLGSTVFLLVRKEPCSTDMCRIVFNSSRLTRPL